MSGGIRTLDSHRQWRHFVSKQRMQILLLAVARNGHASGEECNMPHKDEAHGQATVFAEDLNRWERTDDTDQERYHIGEGRDGDGDGCLRQH